GVDGAIHRKGGPAILEDCRAIVAKIGSLPTGGAVITGGGNLAARHVIHAVGSRYRDGTKGEAALLESAYRESMLRAKENGIRTISFPSISTGIYGYPVEDAAPIALATVWKHLPALGDDAEARFALFDPGTFRAYVEAAEAVLPRSAWRKG
ncbi:MAG TPA: macro domain-containing protein, partial [bacterium]|nr:macro domain-containing protein [bacterium]